jgi:regulator of sigma E protease
METTLAEARSLIIFIVILGGAVALHEAGHLVAALLGRVRLLEAGLGLPPRLAVLGRIRGTLISLNLIPLGGFVRPAGEFGGGEPGDFAARPRPIQALVLAAGPAANMAAAFFLLFAAFAISGPDESLARVVEVRAGSPAEAAGLRPGDVVRWRQFPGPDNEPSLSEMLERAAGHPVSLPVERDGVAMHIGLTPRSAPPAGEGPAGFTTLAVTRPHVPAEAALRAGETLVGFLRGTIKALRGAGPARLVGPLGLKQASDFAVESSERWASLFPILYLAALIHTGLALTNMLPIPALDGGRLLLLGFQALGLRLPPRVTKAFVGASALGLLCLMAALTVRDLIDPLL